MEKGTIGLNRDAISDQPVMKVSPRRLSLRDSGLIHLFDELDIEVPFMKFRRCETFGDATDFVCELLDE